MSIFKGGTEISDLYVGPNEVKEVYRGSDLIWSSSVQRTDPLWSDTIALWTHEAVSYLTLSWVNQVTGNVDIVAVNGTSGNNQSIGIQDGYWGTHLGKTSTLAASSSGAVLVNSSSQSWTDRLSLGSGDFTIEFWTYQFDIITNPVNNQISTLFDATFDGSPLVGRWAMSSTSSNGRAKVGNAGLASSASSSIKLDQWQHHALCRSGSTTTYYVDGVAGSSTSNYTGTMGGISKPCLGALYKSSNRQYSCNALFRQVRLTKAARYTGNFTPYQRFYYPGIV